MSHHVNNTEYINLALDVFTEEYLLAHPVKEMEVHYTGETKEGELLKIYRHDQDGRNYIQIKAEARLVFECYLKF
jgi:acyl-ACP thioesterase